MRNFKATSWILAGTLLLMGGTPGHADYSMTDIVDAAKRGDYHAVHRIINDSPNAIGATDANGYTALHWAGIRGPHELSQ